MESKILTLLNIFVPALFGSAAIVAGIKAWSIRPEILANAEKTKKEADNPVIAQYQRIIEDYRTQIVENETRWQKRFDDQASDYKQKLINMQSDLDACKNK